MKSRPQKPERFLLRVEKGALVPADGYTQKLLREKGYRRGDMVLARLTKPRTPWYHRKVHVFGQLLAENVEDFEGLDAHQVLKRIQLEANIGCDEMALNFPGVGPVTYRIPRSLSYANLDQAEFETIYGQMCGYVVRRYWPDLDESQIEEMAELLEGSA